jgi:hypothetical protein
LPLPAALVLAGGLLAGCGSPEPEHGPARPPVDQVELGRGVDAGGRVPKGEVRSGFAPGEPIHLSMDVAGAPAGSRIGVAVREATTDQAAWAQQKEVVPGRPCLSFAIEPALPPGTYRAEVTLGGQVIAGKPFQVLEAQP